MAAIKVILNISSAHARMYFLEKSDWFRKILVDKGGGCLYKPFSGVRRILAIYGATVGDNLL
jgi:hypothetical protein